MLINRPGRFAALSAAAVLTGLPLSSLAATVTNYQSDFQGAGWQYLWNAPSNWNVGAQPAMLDGTTGPITSVADYEPLIESSTANLLTADGAQPSAAAAPGQFMRLTSFDGQPGAGRAQAAGVNNNVERFVIAAYTVADDGIYSIVDSVIDRNAGSAGTDNYVNVRIFTDDPADPVLDIQAFDEPRDFNVEIGALTTGDTIYVAVGADRFVTGDFFIWNFSIDQAATPIPEPAALGLGISGMTLLLARRAR